MRGDITGGFWLSGGFCCVGSIKMLPEGHMSQEDFDSVKGFSSQSQRKSLPRGMCSGKSLAQWRILLCRVNENASGGACVPGNLWLSGGFCCVGSMKMLPKGHVFREIFGSVKGFSSQSQRKSLPRGICSGKSMTLQGDFLPRVKKITSKGLFSREINDSAAKNAVQGQNRPSPN